MPSPRGNLSDEERTARKRKAMQFQAMEPKERLAHFGEVAGEMCSDGWRVKFRAFVERFSRDITLDDSFAIEICDHSCIEGFLFKESGDLSGCQKCRDAFWKLVDLAALDW